jgi:hypothetical protein
MGVKWNLPPHVALLTDQLVLAVAETDWTSPYVAGSSPGHLELLPDEGTDAAGAALGPDQDRIRRSSESRAVCALIEILVRSR